MSESKAITTQDQAPTRKEIRVVQDTGEFANLLDTAKFEHLYRVAGIFSESTMIPDHYRKQIGNCFIAVQMAVRMGIDPFMFMQRSYVVHGKPGIEAQLAIALINTSGLFENALDYEIHCDDPDGDPFDPSYRVRAWATRKATGKVVLGPWVDWPLVEGEGWQKKEGSKWKTMPGIMFQYRAATFFGRLHCPERLAGMSTADELEDMRVVDVKGEIATNDEKPRRLSLRGHNKPQNTGADDQPSPTGSAAGPASAPPNNEAGTTPGAVTGQKPRDTGPASPGVPSPTKAEGGASTATAPASGRPKLNIKKCQNPGCQCTLTDSGECPNCGPKKDTTTSGPGAGVSNAEGQTSSAAAGNSFTDGPSAASPAPSAEDFPDEAPEPVKVDPKVFRAQCREKAIAEVNQMTPEQMDALVGMTAESDDPRIHGIWLETLKMMKLSATAKATDILGPMKKKAAQYCVLFGLLTPAS